MFNIKNLQIITFRDICQTEINLKLIKKFTEKFVS